MTEFLIRLRAQVNLFWGGLNPRQRIVVLGGTSLLAIVLIVVLRVSGRQEFSTLFSGLEASDAAAIVAQLEDQGVAFELADGGNTIRVPAQQVLDQRLKMAAQGIPSRGTVGFEIFDQVSFTITDLTQRVNFQRALEGELVRTILSLDAVQAARVHLVLPKPTLFTEQQAETTASVVLSLKSGRSLAPENVSAIRNLVASSVEKLSPKLVTIVDSTGRVLTEDLDAQEVFGGAAGARQLDVQRAYENELESDIQRFIATVVGPNKSAVNVKTEFNWDSVETVTESFVPAEGGSTGIPRSEQKINESFVGPPQEAPGGIPGVSANIPGATEAKTETAASGQSQYNRSESIINFDITKSQSKLVSSTGKPSKLAISVFLDASIAEADVTTIQQALTALTDATRGDTVSVGRLAFDTTLADEAQRQIAAAESQARITQMVTLAVVALVVIAVLFFLFRLTRAIRRAVVPPAVTVEALPAEELARLGLPEGMSAEEARRLLLVGMERDGQVAMLPAGEEGLPPREEEGMLAVGEEELGELPPDMEQQDLDRILRERERTRSRLLNLARDRPEEVVRLLETWLAQD